MNAFTSGSSADISKQNIEVGYNSKNANKLNFTNSMMTGSTEEYGVTSSGIGGSILQASSKLGTNNNFTLNEPSSDSMQPEREAVVMTNNQYGLRNREAGTMGLGK